jgi:hypothetical protein
VLISLSRLTLQSAEHLLIANRLQHFLSFLRRHSAIRHNLRLAHRFLRLRILFTSLLLSGTQRTLRRGLALLVFRLLRLLRFFFLRPLALRILFRRSLRLLRFLLLRFVGLLLSLRITLLFVC